MIWLGLLRRFWYVVPILLLTAALGVTRHQLATRTEQRNRALDNLALVQSQLTHVRQTLVQQEDVARHAKETADAQLSSALAAVDLVSGDLRRRLLVWSADHHSAGPSAGADPAEPEDTAGVDPIPQAVGDALAACWRDAQRLKNAVDWAETVSREQQAAGVGAGRSTAPF